MSNRIVTKENCKTGDKVVRGRDWTWGNQDEGSVYGIIKEHYRSNCVLVSWINHKGIVIHEDVYRVCPSDYDLYFYE